MLLALCRQGLLRLLVNGFRRRERERQREKFFFVFACRLFSLLFASFNVPTLITTSETKRQQTERERQPHLPTSHFFEGGPLAEEHLEPETKSSTPTSNSLVKKEKGPPFGFLFPDNRHRTVNKTKTNLNENLFAYKKKELRVEKEGATRMQKVNKRQDMIRKGKRRKKKTTCAR